MRGNTMMKLVIKYFLGIGATHKWGSHTGNGKELRFGVNEHPFPLALVCHLERGLYFPKV